MPSFVAGLGEEELPLSFILAMRKLCGHEVIKSSCTGYEWSMIKMHKRVRVAEGIGNIVVF